MTLMHFCPLDKIQTLKCADTLLSFEYNKSENMMPFSKVMIGTEAKNLISAFGENEKKVFLYGVKRFFIKLCDELKTKLPLKNRALANLRFLKPENRKSDGERMVIGCAKLMPPVC